MNLIEVEDFYFTHAFCSSPVLKGVNLSVEKGDIVALIGESGCGKTTLMMALLGLAPEFIKGEVSGHVRIAGCTNRREFRNVVEPVFQNPETQLFSLRVKEELLFQLRKTDLPVSQRKKRAGEILEEFGLARLADRRIDALSWGEKQKLALACAVAPQPDILMLDEPLSGLDPVHKEIFLDKLKTINKRYGTTIVIIEHEVPLLMKFADHVYLLKNGLLENIDDDMSTGIGVAHDHCCFDPDNSDIIAELKSVSHSYSRTIRALERVDMDLFRKECVAVIGPNGAGKSTIAKCISRLMVPKKGEVRLFGQDARKAKRELIARQTGYMFQNPDRQLFAQTAREECFFASKNFGIPPAEAEEYLAAIARALDITRLLDRPPVTMSYGEKKRVALASVLTHRPDLLVLDEPVAGLDQWNANRMLNLLKNTHHSGAGIILITHDMNLVRNLATRVAFMQGGRKIFEGSSESFLESDWRELYLEKSG